LDSPFLESISIRVASDNLKYPILVSSLNDSYLSLFLSLSLSLSLSLVIFKYLI